MKTFGKQLIGILLAMMAGAAQSAWAQASVTTADALYNAVLTSQTVTLGQDITLRTDGRLHIDGTTVTLDLNGHTLTRPMTAADAGGQVIAVMNGGKLTVTDSSGSNSGKITGGWSYQGSGIYVYEGCSLTISGGTITGNRADKIEGEGTNYGYGGGIENHGTLTITGGVITGNTAGQFGGGIHNEGTLTITGGTITGNTAGTYGGAIYSNSMVSISSATIKGNTAQTDGGAICTEGTLTLDGVTIQGNSAQYGGGIYMFKSAETSPGTVQLKGTCTITGNTATSYGKDVYQNQGTTFNVQDRPVVNDVYLTEYSFITLTGPLTTGASIGLNAQKVDQTHLTLHYPDYHAGTDPNTFFTSKNDSYAISLRPLGVDGANEVAYGVKYIERAWDATEKRVTETVKVCSNYISINGNDTSDETGWYGLYNGWYVVTGNSAYKTLNVQGNDVHLIIPDGVTLTVTGGVKVELKDNAVLNIYGQAGNTGLLIATNSYDGAAGIGSGGSTDDGNAGMINIHGGTITATGNTYGAGIGGGDNHGFGLQANNSGLNVYGGHVTAQGGKYAAGIGSGDEAPDFAGYVTIYGGIVNATGGEDGAGIGGGNEGAGGIVDIYGGEVTAQGGVNGAGIGGGDEQSNTQVNIYGGVVNATGGADGAGIGGGCVNQNIGEPDNFSGGYITISGGTVIAQAIDDSHAAAIGGGGNAGCSGNITISGGNVTATSWSGAGIGASVGGKCNAIKISNGTISADSFGGSGIGSYYQHSGGSIEISGGTVTAIGRKCGIGGYDGTVITISGGEVTASGQTRIDEENDLHKTPGGFGIALDNAKFNMNGGTLTATAYDRCSGIECFNGSTVNITGGMVTATGGIGSAGIGSKGLQDAGETINISGGTVYAHGGEGGGAGIGGGLRATEDVKAYMTEWNNSGSSSYIADFLTQLGTFDFGGYGGIINITGGKVIATTTTDDTSSSFCPPIGSFKDANPATVTIYGSAKVAAGTSESAATGIPSSERIAACTSVGNNYVIIEPCTHSEAYVIDNATQHHHGDCTYCGAGSTTAEEHVFGTDGKCVCGLYSLKDDADNGEVISALTADQNPHPVTLTGRTLWKDGAWNTLCLPFALGDSNTDDNLTFTGTPLEGATVKTLSSTAFDSKTGTLTLNFSTDLSAIEAGKPYLVKWAATTPSEVVNPVFSGVTIVNTTSDVETDELAFRGIYAPLAIKGEDRSLLYLGAGNKLYYPSAAMTIGAFRAYFQLADGITASSDGSLARIVLNFGDEDSTQGVSTPLTPARGAGGEAVTLDGRRLTGKPSAKGLYIYNGKKIVIK
jgi:predicted outer membrane repeat protein